MALNAWFRALYSERHNLLKFTICWAYLLKLGINFKDSICFKQGRQTLFFYWNIRHLLFIKYLSLRLFLNFILGMLQLLEFLYLEYNWKPAISDQNLTVSKRWYLARKRWHFKSLTLPWILEEQQTVSWRASRFNKCDFVSVPLKQKCKFQCPKNWLITSYFRIKWKMSHLILKYDEKRRQWFSKMGPLEFCETRLR